MSAPRECEAVTAVLAANSALRDRLATAVGIPCGEALEIIEQAVVSRVGEVPPSNC